MKHTEIQASILYQDEEVIILGNNAGEIVAIDLVLDLQRIGSAICAGSTARVMTDIITKPPSVEKTHDIPRFCSGMEAAELVYEDVDLEDVYIRERHRKEIKINVGSRPLANGARTWYIVDDRTEIRKDDIKIR